VFAGDALRAGAGSGVWLSSLGDVGAMRPFGFITSASSAIFARTLLVLILVEVRTVASDVAQIPVDIKSAPIARRTLRVGRFARWWR